MLYKKCWKLYIIVYNNKQRNQNDQMTVKTILSFRFLLPA